MGCGTGTTNRYPLARGSGGVKLCAKTIKFIFKLLTNFSVLSFEVVEGLADYVEFVDL